MPDVSIFNLGGQNITVKDATARSDAQSANTAAAEALKKVENVEKLSRVTVSYSPTDETITITTATHAN